MQGHCATILLFFLFQLAFTEGYSQNSLRADSPAVYISIIHPLTVETGSYRSRQSGNWEDLITWQRFDGTNWVNATARPNNTNSNGITIQNTHAVTMNTWITADQVLVESGGILTCYNEFSLADGEGDDLVILGKLNLSGGKISGTGTIMVSGILFWGQGQIMVGKLQVNTGGKLHLYTSGPKILGRN